MKEKRNILIGIGLGTILGWTLGFLRLPYLEKNYSFTLGFIACLSIFLIVFLILSIWKKNTTSFNFLRQNPSSENPSKSYSLLWLLVSILIVIGGLASSFFIFKQNQFSKNQIHHVDKQSAEQLELMASTRKSNALVLMNSLFEKIDTELKNNPQRTLSKEIIERIAALNHSFEPYRYLEDNQLSEKKWSPERGQLLLMLAKMDIDSSSFYQIKMKTSFLGADLRGVDLSKADLSYTDLRESNFDNATLVGANLSNAILEKASLQKVDLKKASLQKSICQYADMQWSNFHLAIMAEADLSSANLSNTNLKEVNLTNANLKWINLSNTFLNDSDLTEVNLFESNLTRANLERANLSKADLTSSTFNEANLYQANMSDVRSPNLKVDVENWFEKLESWKVVGRKKIQEDYKVIIDISPFYKYKLQSIKK